MIWQSSRQSTMLAQTGRASPPNCWTLICWIRSGKRVWPIPWFSTAPSSGTQAPAGRHGVSAGFGTGSTATTTLSISCWTRPPVFTTTARRRPRRATWPGTRSAAETPSVGGGGAVERVMGVGSGGGSRDRSRGGSSPTWIFSSASGGTSGRRSGTSGRPSWRNGGPSGRKPQSDARRPKPRRSSSLVTRFHTHAPTVAMLLPHAVSACAG